MPDAILIIVTVQTVPGMRSRHPAHHWGCADRGKCADQQDIPDDLHGCSRVLCGDFGKTGPGAESRYVPRIGVADR